MSPEEQRIAIAEWCGWKIEPHNQGRRLIDPEGRIVNHNYAEPWRLPNYSEDLNHIHEAEKLLLTGDGWKERLAKYSSKLMSVMHDTDFGRIDVAFKGDMVHLRYFTLHATAAQRAEALLRTIGKWTEHNIPLEKPEGL